MVLLFDPVVAADDVVAVVAREYPRLGVAGQLLGAWKTALGRARWHAGAGRREVSVAWEATASELRHRFFAHREVAR